MPDSVELGVRPDLEDHHQRSTHLPRVPHRASRPGHGILQRREFGPVAAIHLRARRSGAAQRPSTACRQVHYCRERQKASKGIVTQPGIGQFFAQRHPRYLIRLVNKHEEFYALLALWIERHYLTKYSSWVSLRFECWSLTFVRCFICGELLWPDKTTDTTRQSD